MRVPEVNVYDWHESESYWKQMENHIPHIKKLYIYELKNLN